VTIHQAITEQEQSMLRQDVPPFRPGDTLKIAVRVIEGTKERIQNYEGVCIRRRGEGLAETITVRRVAFGVGMERIFPLHSPRIESISVIRAGRVRRAKLYFLRDLSGKAARIADLTDRPGRGTKVLTFAETKTKKNRDENALANNKKKPTAKKPGAPPKKKK